MPVFYKRSALPEEIAVLKSKQEKEYTASSKLFWK